MTISKGYTLVEAASALSLAALLLGATLPLATKLNQLGQDISNTQEQQFVDAQTQKEAIEIFKASK